MPDMLADRLAQKEKNEGFSETKLWKKTTKKLKNTTTVKLGINILKARDSLVC